MSIRRRSFMLRADPRPPLLNLGTLPRNVLRAARPGLHENRVQYDPRRGGGVSIHGRMRTEGFPFIDSPSIDVMASPQRCWDAMTTVIGGRLERSGARAVAAVLGCDDRVARGSHQAAGSTLAGFHVARSDPPVRWRLEGAHRFSQYSLEFLVEDLRDGRSRVHAESRARFSGWYGTMYRALVIGSHGHRVVVRRMLEGIKRHAETTARTSPAS